MATIYRKTNLNPNQPSGYDNTLILEPQESILYPFDIGDYREVRIGMLWTFTTNTGDNGPINEPSTDTVIESVYTTTHPRKSFYLGLNNNKLALPYTSGCDFLGIGIWSGTSSSVCSLGRAYIYGFGITAGKDLGTPSRGYADLLRTHNFTSLSGGSFGNNNGLGNFHFDHLDFASQFKDGSGSNIMYYGFVNMTYIFQTNSGGKMTYSVRVIPNRQQDDTSPGYRVYDSSNRTIKLLNSLPNGLYFTNTTLTGYWTEDFSSGSPNLPKPTAFFMYNPFFLYRPRVHNIIVEKYA